MKKMIDLEQFADGAMAERFNAELQKVLENIADPNTDAKKVRKLTLTVAFKSADDKRDVVQVSVQAKTTLAPATNIETKLIVDHDTNGEVVGAELKSGVKGQTFIDSDGDISDDTGNKIIEFK